MEVYHGTAARFPVDGRRPAEKAGVATLELTTAEPAPNTGPQIVASLLPWGNAQDQELKPSQPGMGYSVTDGVIVIAKLTS